MTKKATRRDTSIPVADDEAPNPASPPYPVVGIGASAGGLAAVEAFFTHMPADAGVEMAFVLVQHLAPQHKSILTELVQRFTQMTVTEISDGVAIQPNNVYIIPPNHDLELYHGTLHLMELVTVHGLHLPIDAFFRSLARDQREQTICIVLSGAGSDGALGVRAVNEAGGMTMAQLPESAEYASMPQSAIATGLVDYVLPPAEMPAALLSYVRHSFTREERKGEEPTERAGELLQKIFILLRAQTRHDFAGYKPNTVRRRIERRMAVHRIETLADYVRYLQQTPLEVQTLFRELLIGVTRFFRDPEAFTTVSLEVVPHLFEGRNPGDAVRVWVPGCSTGEEAFSLAMLLFEYAQEQHAGVKVAIFATDIDAVAIEKARAGVYPANIAADIEPTRLERFFTPDGNTYAVKKVIRDMVVFAEQDVLLDPPFSHIDFISCRNLLIYLNAEVQKRLLPIFHYALDPQGFLFLGASESVGEFTNLFTPIDRKWKIYRRKDVVIPYRQLAGVRPPLAAGAAAPHAVETKGPSAEATNFRASLEQYLLDHHTPAGVLINESGDILFIHGSTGRYLEPAQGLANFNIKRMAREGLRLELITALQQAVARGKAVRHLGVRILGDDRSVTLNLLVTPLAVSPGLFIVVFEEVETKAAEKKPGKPAVSDRDQRAIALEQELQAKEDYLQRHVEEVTTNNEELQSANEELQSSNEELDTSKEELQSVNEELATVNTELQRNIDALTQVNDDMQNLLSSIEVGTVFVDAELRVQRFTTAITDIINLIPNDIGRPLNDITVNLRGYDRLAADAKQVFETLVKKEIEVQAVSTRWYLIRILPYRTQDNAIAGVVITFSDITRMKTLQVEMQQLKLYAENIVDTVREPLLVLDANLSVISANSSFYEFFQVEEAATIGKRIYDLGNEQWDIPELRRLLEEILPEKSCFNDYVVRHTFAEIGPRILLLNARELRQVDSEQRMILLAIEDITGNE
jgi:two-component system CheB/CheR fusion protein